MTIFIREPDYAKEQLGSLSRYIDKLYEENETNMKIISSLNERMIEKDNKIRELEQELAEWKKNFQ